MATSEEREICTAPPGKYQIVYIDPRDHWPTREGVPGNLEEVRLRLEKMIWPQRDAMEIFDSKGERVALEFA